MTGIPNLIINNDYKLIICDCPGFKDTKGSHQEIINSFSIDCLLDNTSGDYNKITILLVISAAELDAERGQLTSENFKRIETMFPDKNELENGIGIIFTKTDNETDVLDYIDELSEEGDETVKHWCEFFQNHPEKIFSLPKASKKNVDEAYEYNELEDLLYFIITNQIENPIHKHALSKDANDYLSKVRLLRNEQLNEIITKIFLSINNEFSKITDLQSLNNWSDILDNFMKLEIHDTKELKDVIHHYLPKNDIFAEYEKILVDFEALDLFLNRVFINKKSKIQKIFKENVISSITQLGSIKQHVQINESKQEQLMNQRKLMEKQEQITKDLKEQLSEQKKSSEKYKIEMKKKFELQSKEMNEMKDKLHLFENYDFIAKRMTNKIQSDLVWQQVYCRPGLEEKELKGIICYFNDELNEIIQVTSNSILNSSYMPDNVIKYTESNYYCSRDKENSYICFDFLESKVQLQSYLIKSTSKNFLKNWKLEGSNNGINWDYIDKNSDSEGLNYSNIRCVYIVYWNKDKYYRYVRLTQTGLNWNNNYQMEIAFIEFYGRIQLPKLK